MQKYSSQVAWSEEDNAYVATSPEFTYLSGVGDTPEEALRELGFVLDAAVDAFIEDGKKLPEPLYVQEFSGQLRLRLPKSQHAELARLAEREGMSLNSYLMHLISIGQGKCQAESEISRDLKALRNGLEARAEGRMFQLEDVSQAESQYADVLLVNSNTSH